MGWQRIALVVEGRHAEALAEALEQHGALSTDIADADAGTPEEEAVFGEPGSDAALWPRCRVSALFPESHDASTATREALAEAGAASLAAASIDRLEDADWVRETQRQFEPIRAGKRLWIVPTWHDAPEPGAVNLVLDPGAAFGTGSHPTTRMCLAWLEERVRPGDSVLDYGCGSGILAIAAAMLGAGPVTAVDIDPLALDAARYNSQRNRVSLDLRPAHQKLPSLHRVTVANILANPLRMLAPLLCAHTEPGGSIALSGILAGQATSVIEAYAPWSALGVAGEEQGWVLLAGTRTA
jgi:ribosomal protein L11 methyltransferase